MRSSASPPPVLSLRRIPSPALTPPVPPLCLLGSALLPAADSRPLLESLPPPLPEDQPSVPTPGSCLRPAASAPPASSSAAEATAFTQVSAASAFPSPPPFRERAAVLWDCARLPSRRASPESFQLRSFPQVFAESSTAVVGGRAAEGQPGANVGRVGREFLAQSRTEVRRAARGFSPRPQEPERRGKVASPPATPRNLRASPGYRYHARLLGLSLRSRGYCRANPRERLALKCCSWTVGLHPGEESPLPFPRPPRLLPPLAPGGRAGKAALKRRRCRLRGGCARLSRRWAIAGDKQMPVSWEASPLCVCFSTKGSLSLKAEQGPGSGS